ncbi:MAG: HPr family phosphocarrier protein, partial [Deltaproteobacteria bacterium]|nr:HPr family phosphocarrier protein [Deltaproteobacteria bacterium]
MKRSLTEVISEEAFLRLAREHSRNFLRIHNFLQKERRSHTRRFYSHLIEESEELESFLDDHCARDNRTWYFYVELVACIRNLAKVAFILEHILHRYHAYGLQDHDAVAFLKDARNASIFLDDVIYALFDEIKKESLRLGMKPSRGTLKEASFGEFYPQKRLPYTIDEDAESDSRKVLAKVASQYLGVVGKVENFGWNQKANHSDPQGNLVPHKVDEERSREVAALIHNLQSTYDHYVRRTPLEARDERLKRFRSFIAMPLHLMTMVNWLSHLHQRHILTAGQTKGCKEISAIVDGPKITNIVVRFALFHANRYLQAGKELAREILEKYTEVGTCELKVPEKLGFHLRPASLIAKLAKYYGTKLSLIVDGRAYDASNVLSISMAAGLVARKGYKTVLFEGDRRVLADLKLLASCNYGEDKKGNPTGLPQELSHLWL